SRYREFGTALTLYTESMNLNPTREIYSNRCVVFMALKQCHQALNDAKQATEIDPNWIRGWRRRAACLDHLKRDAEALQIYKELLAALDDKDNRFGMDTAGKEREKKDIEPLIAKLESFLDKAEPQGLARIQPITKLSDMPSIKVFNKAQ